MLILMNSTLTIFFVLGLTQRKWVFVRATSPRCGKLILVGNFPLLPFYTNLFNFLTLGFDLTFFLLWFKFVPNPCTMGFIGFYFFSTPWGL